MVCFTPCGDNRTNPSNCFQTLGPACARCGGRLGRGNQSAADFVRLPSYCWNRESYWFNTDEVRLSWLVPDTHVLLGRRITATKPTWELELDPRLFPYLNDHRFWDRIVFPAAGYGEMGIALARELFPGEPHAVEELDIKSALFVSEDKSLIVRVVFQDADNRCRFTVPRITVKSGRCMPKPG